MRKRLGQRESVIRYVGSSKILDDGTIHGSAFRLRRGEPYLSVQWFEFYRGKCKCRNIRDLAMKTRLDMKASGRLARVRVGKVVEIDAEMLGVRRYPLPASCRDEEDLSHCGVTGLPEFGALASRQVGDRLAMCVDEKFQIPNDAVGKYR